MLNTTPSTSAGLIDLYGILLVAAEQPGLYSAGSARKPMPLQNHRPESNLLQAGYNS